MRNKLIVEHGWGGIVRTYCRCDEEPAGDLSEVDGESIDEGEYAEFDLPVLPIRHWQGTRLCVDETDDVLIVQDLATEYLTYIETDRFNGGVSSEKNKDLRPLKPGDKVTIEITSNGYVGYEVEYAAKPLEVGVMYQDSGRDDVFYFSDGTTVHVLESTDELTADSFGQAGLRRLEVDDE